MNQWFIEFEKSHRTINKCGAYKRMNEIQRVRLVPKKLQGIATSAVRHEQDNQRGNSKNASQEISMVYCRRNLTKNQQNAEFLQRYAILEIHRYEPAGNEKVKPVKYKHACGLARQNYAQEWQCVHSNINKT